jgi:hypothetical protein
MQRVAFHCERIIEASFQAKGNFFHNRPAANDGDHRGKLIAAQAGKHIVSAELAFHAGGHFLKV